MKLRRDAEGLKLIRETEQALDLAALRTEKDRLTQALEHIQNRIAEIEAIMQAAKKLSEGQTVEVKR